MPSKAAATGSLLSTDVTAPPRSEVVRHCCSSDRWLLGAPRCRTCACLGVGLVVFDEKDSAKKGLMKFPRVSLSLFASIGGHILVFVIALLAKCHFIAL